jgi:hypothetical protein
MSTAAAATARDRERLSASKNTIIIDCRAYAFRKRSASKR